ncbi:MAG TPA: hypothetical protein VF482_02170, partial [Trebonia sp.]
MSIAAALARAPFTARARRELLFCLLGLPFGIFVPLAGFVVTFQFALLDKRSPWVANGNPSWLLLLVAVAVAAVLAMLMVMTGAARGLTAASRRLAA